MTISTHDDNDTDDSYAGLTLTGVYRKHRALRGTDDLKYLGERRLRCQTTCGLDDMPVGKEWGDGHMISHQCYKIPNHEGDHEFSSECGGSRFREVVQ